MRWLGVLGLPLVLLSLGGCRIEGLTNDEAREALDEAAVASQAAALMSASVEITTDFTIGEAVETAAEEIRDFIVSQLPCAEITLAQATLTVEYGANAGNCTYRGHTFEGVHTVEVARNDAGEVIVEHTWDALANGRVTVSGGATVTWSTQDPSRHVMYDLEWTRLSDERSGVGTGDVTQTPLDGDITQGIAVDGERAWEGESGRWSLDIDEVEMRWFDPVPQAGAWTLDTPFDKQLSLSFERIDDDSIAVSIESGKRSFDLTVHRSGLISSN